MIDVFFKGGKYRFHKTQNDKYWTGVSGGGHFFPGANCVAPRGIWQILQKKAVESGVSREVFITKEPEKKKAVTSVSKKKSKKPSISIF